MPTLSDLSESDVSRLVGETYAGRGDRYQYEGRIVGPQQSDDRLVAMCQGSQPSPYRVEVVIGDEGDIERTSCNCPVAGPCKHVAALLYEWIRNPEGFGVESELEMNLRELSQERLIQLVVNLVEVNPQLHDAVQLQLTTAQLADEAGDGTADYDEFYGQTERILASQFPQGMGWRHLEVSIQDLGVVFSAARQFLEDDQPQNAGIVASALVACLLEYFDEFAGIDEYVRETSEAVRLLTRTFEATADPTGRSRLLPHLWSAWRWDVKYGGIGLMGAVESSVLEMATGEERDYFRRQLNEYLEEINADGARSSSWRRGAIAEFSLALQDGELDDEEYVEQCRRFGDVPRLVDALLSIEAFEEAKERASKVDTGKLLRLTEIFIAHGREDDAVELAQTAAENTEGFEEARCRRWLREYFEHREDAAAALSYALWEFEQRSTVENLDPVRRLAEETGEWEEVRQECLGRLEEKSPKLLMDWYLHIDDPGSALEVWEESDSMFRHFWASLPELADGIADSHPEVAVDIWSELAERRIERRGRKNYRKACRYFARIRQVYRDQGRPEEFTELAEWLFEEHNRLPAFKDEMRKAGLAPEE